MFEQPATPSTLRFLASVNAASSTFIELTGLKNDFKKIILKGEGLVADTSNVILQMQLYTAGVLRTASYIYAIADIDAAFSRAIIAASLPISSIGAPTGNAVTDLTRFTAEIETPAVAVRRSLNGECSNRIYTVADQWTTAQFYGQYAGDTNAVDGVRIFYSAGLIVAGSLLAYGLKG